jgi:hypothetical protein
LFLGLAATSVVARWWHSCCQAATAARRLRATAGGAGGVADATWSTRRLVGRAREAAVEPCTDVGEGREIELDRLGPAHDRGEVEIGYGEGRTKQIVAALQRAVQHVERLGQRLLRLGHGVGLALVGGCHEHVDQDREKGLLDLGHAPEAPLVADRPVLEAGRHEAVLVVLGGEIEIYRHRLEKLEVAVDQGRHRAVGIDLQVVGVLEILHLHGDVLERYAELVHDPQCACRT